MIHTPSKYVHRFSSITSTALAWTASMCVCIDETKKSQFSPHCSFLHHHSSPNPSRQVSNLLISAIRHFSAITDYLLFGKKVSLLPLIHHASSTGSSCRCGGCVATFLKGAASRFSILLSCGDTDNCSHENINFVFRLQAFSL